MTPLGAEDLQLLATSAHMTGRHEDMVSALERAYGSYLATGRALNAVRCAFWAGMDLAFRGETRRACDVGIPVSGKGVALVSP